jgi:hypothetical protein
MFDVVNASLREHNISFRIAFSANGEEEVSIDGKAGPVSEGLVPEYANQEPGRTQISWRGFDQKGRVSQGRLISGRA